jgi:intracellular septation protein A
MLFWALNSVIIVFGVLDLLLSNQLFIKYEAFLTNIIIAIFWAASLFKDKSIVQEIAESQGRVDPSQSIDKRFFFNIFTIFWSAYFLLKGLFYYWTYQNTNMDNALIVRIFVGKISLWIMIGSSTLLPRKIWKLMEWFKVFPSQKMRFKETIY